MPTPHAPDPDRRTRNADLFGRIAPHYDAVVPFFRTFAEALVRWVALREGQSVLDVGCGRGAVAFEALAAVGPFGRVTGVDVAGPMVEALRADLAAAGAGNVIVRTMPAEELLFPDACFDAALAGFALNLLGDPRQGLAELRRVLRPGATLAFSVPHGVGARWEFLEGLVRDFGARARALSLSTDADLVALAREAGFVDVEIRCEEVSFPLPDVDAFWRWQLSHGFAAFYDSLSDADRRAFRAAVDERLAMMAGGIVIERRALFVKARAPA